MIFIAIPCERTSMYPLLVMLAIMPSQSIAFLNDSMCKFKQADMHGRRIHLVLGLGRKLQEDVDEVLSCWADGVHKQHRAGLAYGGQGVTEAGDEGFEGQGLLREVPIHGSDDCV